MILAGLAAAFQVLSFPPWGWSALAWVALVPLLAALATVRARGGLVVGWLFGSVAALGLVTGWLWPALTEFFGAPLGARVGVLALAAELGGGLALAVFGWVVARSGGFSPPARVLITAAAWVAAEYVRGILPYAMPWAPLGAALAPAAPVAQVADLGGVYAVSFVLAVVSAAVVEVGRYAWPARGASSGTLVQSSGTLVQSSGTLVKSSGTLVQSSGTLVKSNGTLVGSSGTHVKSSGTLAAVTTALLVVLAAGGYGLWRGADVRRQIAAAPTLRVALVHAELENARRQGAATAAGALDRYLALSPPADSVDLVVWPENAVNLLLEDNPDLVARIAAHAGATPYLVGAPRTVATAGGRTLRTSALVIAGGAVTASYDKRRLLPFAETMPSWRGEGGARPQDFTSGTTAAVLTVGGVRLGPLICYEAIFPALARATVRAGAELLVNLSNDSWFPAGAGPEQHARFAELRAVELRRTLVRAANRGTTMIVLPDGRLSVATDGATPGVEIATVPLLTTATVYAAVGDCFAWLCVALAASAALAAGRTTEARPVGDR